MFVVVRSVFWLTAAYLVIKPGADLPDAQTAAAQALAAGKQVVAEQVETIQCNSLECIGGKAVAAAILQPSSQAGVPMHAMPAGDPIPFPRPRPDRAG